MKKIIVTTTTLVALLVIAFGVVFVVLEGLASIGSPISLKEKSDKHQLDLSFTLHNKSDQSVSIGSTQLKPDASIELRSLSQTLFIRWSDGASNFNKPLMPSRELKLENSIYGKYSIRIDKTKWKQLIEASISEIPCKRYNTVKTWFSSIPSKGLFLTVRDESKNNFYHNAHYSRDLSNSSYKVELEESFRRDSTTRGSHHGYRYHCHTTGQNDRLGLFITLINDLTESNPAK